MKLLVRNLARTVTEQEILNLFSEYGTVETCTLVLDKETGQSKGFAFVEMPDFAQAKNARNALQHKNIAKSKIRVKFAQD